MKFIELASPLYQSGVFFNIVVLDLFNNQLSSIPVNIGKLTNLKSLDLVANQLPDEEKQRLRNIFGNKVSL